jgi:hypothetical protein
MAVTVANLLNGIVAVCGTAVVVVLTVIIVRGLFRR